MECSFFKFSSNISCSINSNIRPSSELRFLHSCNENIDAHISSNRINSFSVNNEGQLIKFRAGIFEQNADNFTICPNHRYHLGKGWRRSKFCMCRPPLKWCQGSRKAEKATISVQQSKYIFARYGVLIPVGAGVCRKCRSELVQTICEEDGDELLPCGSVDENTINTVAVSDEIENESGLVPEQFDDGSEIDQVNVTDEEASEYTLSQTSCGSIWTPGASQDIDSSTLKRKALDNFLDVCGASPVKKTLSSNWDDCSERTKRDYVLKTQKILYEVLDVLAPGQGQHVLEAIVRSDDNKDSHLLEEIAAGYNSSEDWGTQRQILSLVANKVSFSQLKGLIPNLSRYKFSAARKHALSVGQGQQVPNTERRHEGITNAQINHFLDFVTSPAIITDMPYGDSNLRLSSGETISVPKIILNSVRTRVVEQYFSYCDETDYDDKASISSYMRILHSVGPNVRKSMKGLDNYASDGAKAIESLQKMSELFCRLGKGKEWHDNICRVLSASKHYLKLEYKVHIMKDSEVADHCCRFALSDGTKDYSNTCNHSHSKTCMECEELESILTILLDTSKSMQYENDDQKDDTVYIVSESVRAIKEWKKHVLRTVNQDMARQHTLQTLKDCEVLIERDWAMKFIPLQYRESQSCWFGKRGLNWHITVATFRSGGTLTTHTFIHIFDSATQDAETSNAILSNSLEFLHEIKPSLQFAYIRSDNAGCFHGSVSVCAVPFLSSNIQCVRMDFADPQGGKSICDRKAAYTKSFIRRHVNEGNDVCTASDFKDAVMKSKMKNVTVVVALPPSSKKKEPVVFKIPKITSLNNFCYTEKDHVRVWRQYDTGDGCLVPAVGSVDYLPHLTVLDSYTSNGVEVSDQQSEVISEVEVAQTEINNQQSNVNIDVDVANNEASNQKSDEELLDGSTQNINTFTSNVCEEDSPIHQMSMLFSCSECTRTFQKYGNLLRHLDTGTHAVKSVCQPLSDKAKIEYSKQMEKVNLLTASLENVTPGSSVNLLEQGWALKSRREVKRFTKDQRNYLDEKFEKGEKTGQKYDPEEVSREMRQIRNIEGKKRFTPEEFLSAQQIGSYFSRLVLQKRKKNNISYTEEDLQAEIAEAEFNALNVVSS